MREWTQLQDVRLKPNLTGLSADGLNSTEQKTQKQNPNQAEQKVNTKQGNKAHSKGEIHTRESGHVETGNTGDSN